MDFAVLSLGVFFGAIVSGFSGFAFSASADAVLLHALEPRLVLPLLLVCSALSQGAVLLMLKTIVRWREAALFGLGGIIGVPLALALFGVLDADVYRSGFGLFLVAYVLYLAFKPMRQAGTATRPFNKVAVGFVGGLVGGLTAMPGAVPAMWCELKGSTKEEQRGLVQPFILMMQLYALALLLSRPHALPPELSLTILVALPALAAGTFVGMRLFRHATEQTFRIAVLLLLMISGLMMVRWRPLVAVIAGQPSWPAV